MNHLPALLCCVAAALAGERVVRLKGGDPSIFGRPTEEIAALAAAGVTARICPGITVASAAAASAGRSLSQRGTARQVRFLTARGDAGDLAECEWAAIADPDATLAIYMGRAAVPAIRRNLLAHGYAAATPVLIASDVSLPGEQLIHTRLDLLAVAVDAAAGGSPAVILIGEAARATACRKDWLGRQDTPHLHPRHFRP